MHRKLAAFSLALPLALGHLLLGCGTSQSNGLPAQGQASTASTAAGITAPKGPFPRGTVDPSLLPDPATLGPSIVVVSPERGAAVGVASVAVVVSAVDPDGVAEVSIGGVLATAQGKEQWTAQVTLQAGLNVVELEAKDTLGNRTSGYVSLTQGTLHSTTQPFDKGVSAALTPTGLGRLCDVVADLTSSVDLAPLIVKHNPLLSTAGLKLNGTGLTHAPLHYELEGAPTGARIRVHIDNAVLTGDADFLGFGLTQVTLTADRVTALADPRIDRSLYTGTAKVSKQALGLELDALTVSLVNFRVKASSGFFDTLLSPFKGMIEGEVKKLLQDILLDLMVTELSKALPGVDTPLGVDLPNPLTGTHHPLDLSFTVDQANGSAPTGLVLSAGLAAQARTPIVGSSDLVALEGVPAPRPLVPGPEAFAVQLSADALNAFLHAVWRTDIVQGQIEGRNPSPTQTIALTVNFLYPFLPVVRSLAPDPGTPITLRVRLGSAPRLRFGAAPGVPYELGLGEAEISLEIDYMDGAPNLALFRARIAATATASIAVENDQLKITNLALPSARLDIVEEPAADLADQQIEDFVQAMLPQIMSMYQLKIPAIQIPALPLGLKLTGAKLQVDPGYLTVRGDL
ncbi:MAG: hypothetical protein AB7N76_17260 [Planctomycetota bacterium]